MRKLFVFTTSLVLLIACKENPKNLDPFMVDISEFKIDNTVLKDGDYVEILGSSGNLTEEHEIDFYNLVVVRSVETGDTINVLVTNFYQSYLNKPTTRFISNTSGFGKLVENYDQAEKIDGKKMKDVEAKSYKKVFYDSEYIQVDVRSYPAITGNLGDYTIEGNIDDIDF